MPNAPGPGDCVADRYEILRVIGRGGFGTTFAARDLRTGDHVAIKQLDLRHVDDWKSVELFEREAAVLERLDHPRIPNYVDFVPIEAESAGLLIQELAPGRPLDRVLDEEGRLEEDRVIAIADQVLQILAYLGSLHPPVVHRDIKPANLILDDRGEVRLVDFGAVKDAAARASTIGSTVAGTFGYMAPEIVRGSGEPRSDLYALGMTMISLLTGLAPTDLPSKRLKPDFRGRVHCSVAVLDVIDRLIEPVPDDRYADAKAAREALADAVAASALADPGADLGALVAAQERQRRLAQEQREALARRERDAKAAKLAQRPRRVSVSGGAEQTRITFAPIFLSDALLEQLPWGMGFAFVNPGVFIITGLSFLFILALDFGVGVGIVAAILSWAMILFGLNVLYAQLRRRPRYLDLTADGHFALHSGDPRKAELIGRVQNLRVSIPEPDPSKLSHIDISCGHSERVDRLSAADLTTLREALNGRCHLR
ncbi:MAG: serine/threonine protein kinase [Myxococcales bacterium]|nr:serine/threonine protein kinase [Myxococcales bacterium]